MATANCSNRAVVHAPQGNCWALFYDPEEDPSAATASTAGTARPATTSRPAPPRPGGSLLENLIGTPETKAQARQREQQIDAVRERSAQPSAALQSDEPVLDYLLGGER